MERFLTTMQLGFAVCFLAYAIGRAALCLFTKADAFYTVCFATLAASTWFLMVKSAWAEYKEARTNKKGGQR